MFTRPKVHGCCSSGPAALGDDGLDPGVVTAATAPEISPPPSLGSLFAVSVGAGLTVWLVTKMLGGKKG